MSQPSAEAKRRARNQVVHVKTLDDGRYTMPLDYLPGAKVYVWSEDGTEVERLHTIMAVVEDEIAQTEERTFARDGSIGDVPLYVEVAQ